MSKARELANLGNAYSDGALSNRNLIINGDFKVSQRGDFTSPYAYSSAGYAVDRWKLYDVGCDGRVTHKIKQLVDGRYTNTLYLECVTAGTGRLISRQLIEQPAGYSSHQLDGVTGTVSGWVKSNSQKARIYIYAGFYVEVAHSGNGQWEYLTATITGLPANSPIEVGVQIDAGNNDNTSIGVGDYFEMAYMQLEYGDTATPFEHRSYGQELALCQRYYERQVATATGVRFASGNANGSTTLTAMIPFLAQKRATPTLSYSDIVVRQGGSNTNISSVSVVGTSSMALTADVTTSTSITTGESYHIRASSSGSYLSFDAEL